jgi:hypothetical protein
MMKNNEKSKFEEVQAAENEWLRARRQYAGIQQKEGADKEKKKDPLKYPDTMGLALSGGGIRSATFNLGLLQALERYGLLKCMDYLSTVSGGGYIGSCLTWFMSKLEGKEKTKQKKEPRDFPFGTSRKHYKDLGGKILAWLRSYGKYMTPGEGLNIWALMGAVLTGILVNLLIMVPVFLLLFIGLSQKTPFLFLDEWVKYAAPFVQEVRWFHVFFLVGLALLALFLVTVPLYAVLTHWSRLRNPGVQKCIRTISGGLLKYCVFFLVVGTIPMIYHLLLDKLEVWKPAVMSGVSFSGIIAMFGGGRKRKEGNELKGYRSFLLSLGLSLLVYGLFLWFYHLVLYYIFLNLYLWIALGLSVVLALLADVNQVSMHRFYRNRLMKAYMSDEIKVGPNDTIFNNPDQFYLKDIPRTSSPFHIINTFIQTLGSKDSRLSGRGGDNFIFSPLYCGSDSTAYVKTSEYVKGKMDLSTAFAISGAAVDPNTYATRSRPLSFLMTLLNIRLGYWIWNPHRPGRYFKSMSPLPRWYLYMFAEMFGRGLSERKKKIHLSDGGHFENLGLYELIRRRCKYIIVSDAGADKNYNFKDLVKAIEMVRLDFGAKIEINTRDLIPQKEDKRSARAFTFGKIDYDEGHIGYLIYIKTTLMEELTEDIYGYQRAHNDFPDQSTMDQFYDEPQFEAYRELGFQLGRKLSYYLDKNIRDLKYEELKKRIEKKCDEEMKMYAPKEKKGELKGAAPVSKKTRE